MVLPAIFRSGQIDPLADVQPAQQTPAQTIFYATDRQYDPDARDWLQYNRYRADQLDLGTIEISYGDDDTWTDMRAAMQGQCDGDGDLRSPTITQINRVAEFGRRETDPLVTAAPFIEQLNAQLDQSTGREITIYVHGFKTNFQNAVLDASEYELYTGGLGPFIVYTWPSYDSLFEYSHDRDSVRFTSAHARRLVAYLADQINAGTLHADRINFIAHSSGVEIVGSVLRELALISSEQTPEERQERWRIGSVLLIAPDISTDVARERVLREDLRGMIDQMVVYLSRHDTALRWADIILYGSPRLGAIHEEDLTEEDHYWLARAHNVTLIDVESSPYHGFVNHSHHRFSPGVASDIILSLRSDLTPTQRGLILTPGQTIWKFAPDYPQRVTEAALGVYGITATP